VFRVQPRQGPAGSAGYSLFRVQLRATIPSGLAVAASAATDVLRVVALCQMVLGWYRARGGQCAHLSSRLSLSVVYSLVILA
jgi:hypothetical protein